MAVKTVKRAIPAKKAPVARKTSKPAAQRLAKGDILECGVCGLALSVDEECGCVEFDEIICCGEAMKPRRARARTAKTVKAAKTTKK